MTYEDMALNPRIERNQDSPKEDSGKLFKSTGVLFPFFFFFKMNLVCIQSLKEEHR